jgi:hypothetical protein
MHIEARACIVSWIVNDIDIDTKDNLGRSPFLSTKDIGMMDLLLTAGANIDAIDSSGYTWLQKAAMGYIVPPVRFPHSRVKYWLLRGANYRMPIIDQWDSLAVAKGETDGINIMVDRDPETKRTQEIVASEIEEWIKDHPAADLELQALARRPELEAMPLVEEAAVMQEDDALYTSRDSLYSRSPTPSPTPSSASPTSSYHGL